MQVGGGEPLFFDGTVLPKKSPESSNETDDGQTEPSYEKGQNGGRDPHHVYAVLCHVAAPLIWPFLRKSSETVDAHGKAALNHMIVFGLLFLVLHVLSGLAIHFFHLSPDIRSLVCIPVLMGGAVFSLLGLVKADQGILMKYPLALRILK